MHCSEALIQPLDAMHIKSKKIFKAKFLVVLSIGNHRAATLGRSCIICLNSTIGNSHSPKTRSMLCKASLNLCMRQHPLHHFMGVPITPPVAFCLGVTYRALPRSPEESFLIGLCWCYFDPGKRRPQFPSWSWAGWEVRLSAISCLKRIGGAG